MLNVEMLPAGQGDALLVEYGTAEESFRILIDGGPYFTYEHENSLRARLRSLSDDGHGEFELLVVTHIDTDHIDGVIKLLQDPELDSLQFNDIWFNDWKHLQPDMTGVLAGVHGEFLGALLEERGLNWNSHEQFGGGPVMVPDSQPLPEFELPGGARVTLLSPGPTELDALRSTWLRSVRAAGFQPGDRKAALAQLEHRARYGPPKGVLGQGPDDKAPNGSSIAFVLAYGDDRLLATGDAWAPIMERSLHRYLEEHGEPLRVRDFKLAHHGSLGNISRRLIELVRAQRYLVSSSSQYYDHPDEDTIELTLKYHIGESPEFVFNYLSPKTRPWADETLQERRGFTASFPTGASWGV